MNILEVGAQLLSDRLGLQVEPAQIQAALSSLLGDGSGNIDLAGLASKMASSGELGNIVSSWLGDGSNASISADSVLGLLGRDEKDGLVMLGMLGSVGVAVGGGMAIYTIVEAMKQAKHPRKQLRDVRSRHTILDLGFQ